MWHDELCSAFFFKEIWRLKACLVTQDNFLNLSQRFNKEQVVSLYYTGLL